MFQASLFSELFKPERIKDRHPDKAVKTQYSQYPCAKCGRDTFMKWIHWPTEKKCTECNTAYILVNDEWRIK